MKTKLGPAKRVRPAARPAAPRGKDWQLRLYVAGQTPRSLAAITNLNLICEEHLKGRYRVQVIDLLLDPGRARVDEIVAIPTLVRSVPTPLRKIIGDLSDRARVLLGLQLRPVPA